MRFTLLSKYDGGVPMADQTMQISSNTINSVFSERKDYIIVALTGKVGSGCSLVSSFLQNTKDTSMPSWESPGLNGFHSDQERENSILLRYYQKNRPEFILIRVRDVITSFLLEGNAWERLRSRGPKNYEVWMAGIQSTFCDKIDSLAPQFINEEKKRGLGGDALEEYKSLLKLISDNRKDQDKCLEVLKKYNDAIFSNNNTKEDEDTRQKREKAAPIFIRLILPELAASIRQALGKQYTFIFQDFGNELRFFGSLDESRANYGEHALQVLGQEFSRTMFTIAERINMMIKKIRKPYGKKQSTAIVIDSMKNKYESNFLRDRYSAYYLFAVSREEETRTKQLLKNEIKSLSQDDIDTIDYNERPGQAAKSMLDFARCLHRELEKETKETNASDISNIREYLNAIKAKNQQSLFGYCTGDKKELITKIINKDEIRVLLEKMWGGTDKTLQEPFKEAGLTLALCKYCHSILNDPLRIFLYKNKLFPFYLQDVEACIQNADIFLTNNEPDDGPKYGLKLSLFRYIALMMHPGLLMPTPVERCMQIAYTAKVNSGCISRQVGAVVTDKDYNILSLGWNDVPCGQTPCLYRNLLDLWRQSDRDAYSDYEWSQASPFHKHIKQYNFSSEEAEIVLHGLPGSFCFKSLNEDVTNEKNPMNARAMHGEEKALLQCNKERAIGGYLFTTSSPCEMCAKNAKEHRISLIYYIEPYPGISQNHVCNSGREDNRAQYVLFEGAIGRAYTQLYMPVLPYKDELTLRGFPKDFLTSKTSKSSESVSDRKSQADAAENSRPHESQKTTEEKNRYKKKF